MFRLHIMLDQAFVVSLRLVSKILKVKLIHHFPYMFRNYLSSLFFTLTCYKSTQKEKNINFETEPEFCREMSTRN